MPTWNGRAVQARGVAALIEDPEVIAGQMRALAARCEPTQGFEMDALPAACTARMFNGLGGVSIEIRDWTAKRKRSQNKPVADRVAVAAALEARGEQAAAAALREANGL